MRDYHRFEAGQRFLYLATSAAVLAMDDVSASVLVAVERRPQTRDELVGATASLDPVSERQVVDGYRRVMRGGTTLVISHRLDIVWSADRVIVLDVARIAEMGPPARLASQSGPFAALFAGAAAVSS